MIEPLKTTPKSLLNSDIFNSAAKINEIIDWINKQKEASILAGCPPHNMVPFVYLGQWAATVSPPNMKCTKCLMETRF